jgi:HD-like signal output (HDOD) protein
MTTILILGGLGAVVVSALLWWLLRSRGPTPAVRQPIPPSSTSRRPATAARSASTGETPFSSPASTPHAAPGAAALAPPPRASAAGPAERHPPLSTWLDVAEPPAALLAWRPTTAAELSPHQLQGVIATFRNVPRPPRLLSRLVSLDLLNAANSAELVGLISGEALIAAKVLAAVNAPAYGLSRPVASVGQAVTYLGLNRVRAICMRYALQQAFQADSPERAERLKALWHASALAGELSQQATQRVPVADPGGLTSAVLLSFLGGLAVTVAMPKPLLGRVPARDHFERSRAEQALLGLSAGEIGRVLMQQWDLPATVIEAVGAIDERLHTAHSAEGDEATLRQAFGYLCARLGERLAWGELDSLAGFDLRRDTRTELALVRPLVQDARFAALLEQLQTPQTVGRVDALLRERRVSPASSSRLQIA